MNNLQKIFLSVRAAGDFETAACEDWQPFVFVYGAGSHGLSGLEKLLSEKTTGDEARYRGSRAEFLELCDHLLQPLCRALGLQVIPDSLQLEMKITAVKDAEDREIVQAIARAAAGSGCRGDCGCGCS